MTPEYFTEAYMDSIAPYIAPLDTEARTVYVEEGEECIPLRAEHGVDAPAFLSLVKNIGIYLNASTGSGFTSDYQKIQVTDTITLYSFQLPGGGNLNVFDTPDGKMVLDTGYGCFYKDCEKMLESLGLDGFFDTRVVICTHGDADHCGASGYFAVKPLMHPTTKELLDVGTRGYGSPNGLEVLEAFYTTTINTFSRMNVPEDVIECETMPVG
ncbi:MAG: MBL fold metallo-hydrolase, partial [Methanocorpusculum sp.]|nr:MBL fold metallo-hydrolase [Methanocorpusculum sp.]